MIDALTVHIETDAIGDFVDQIMIAHRKLASRHGEVFRKLERRIEALMDSPVAPRVHHLTDSMTFIIAPPPEWSDVLVEARRLGVV